MTILSKNTRRGSNQIKSYTVEDAFGNVLTIAKEDFTDWERNNDRDVAMIAGTFVPSNQDEADQVSLAQSRAEMGETAYETLQRQSENPTDDGINAPIEGVDYDIVYDPVTNTSQRVYRGQDVNKATAAANAESSTGLLDDLGMAVSSVKDAVGLGETQKKVANGVTYTLPVNMPTQQSVYEDLAKEYLKTYGADLDLNKQAELMQKAGLIVEDPATMQKVDNSMGSADMGKSLRNAQLSYFDPAAAARRDTGGSGGKGDGSALSDKYSTLESSDRNFGESLSLLMNNMVTDLISLPGAVATDIGKLINGVSNQITGTDLITSTEAPAEAQTFGEAFNAARAAQGDGGVFTYDGKQYTTDLAPAGMDSVISTGGPGTFAPGSLPAATVLDSDQSLATQEGGNSEQVLPEDIGVGGRGPDFKYANPNVWSLSTITPTTDLFTGDPGLSAPVGAGIKVGDPMTPQMAAELGLSDIYQPGDTVLIEDLVALDALGMDVNQSDLSTANIVNMANNTTDDVSVAFPSEALLNQSNVDTLGQSTLEDAKDDLQYAINDGTLDTFEANAIRKMINSGSGDLTAAEINALLPQEDKEAAVLAKYDDKSGGYVNPITGLVAESYKRGDGDPIEGSKQVIGSAVTGSIAIGGKMLQGLDIVGNQIGKYIDSNTGELAQGANPEYDANAQAFLSGMSGTGTNLAATDKTVDDPELTRALNFDQDRAAGESNLYKTGTAITDAADAFANYVGIDRSGASITGDTPSQLELNGTTLDVFKAIAEESGEELTELGLAQAFRKNPILLAIVTGLSTGEAIQAGQAQANAVIEELSSSGQLENTDKYIKYLSVYDGDVEKTKAFLADEIVYNSIARVGTIGFTDAVTNALKMGKGARLLTEAGMEGVQEGVEGWAVLDAANDLFTDLPINTLKDLAGNVATGILIGTGTSTVFNTADAAAGLITNGVNKLKTDPSVGAGNNIITAPIDNTKENNVLNSTVSNALTNATAASSDGTTASETLLTGDPGLGGDNFTASENLMDNSMVDALATANVTYDNFGDNVVLTNQSTGMTVTVPKGTPITSDVIAAVKSNDESQVTDIIKNATITDTDLTLTDNDTITTASELGGIDPNKMAAVAGNAGKTKVYNEETGKVESRNTGNAELTIGGVDINNLNALGLSLDLDGAKTFNDNLADGSLTAADLQNALTEMNNKEANTIETVDTTDVMRLGDDNKMYQNNALFTGKHPDTGIEYVNGVKKDTSGIAGLGSEEQYELNLTGGTGTQLTDVGNTGLASLDGGTGDTGTGDTGTGDTGTGNTGIASTLTQEQLNAITGNTALDVNALTTSQADVVTGTNVNTNQTTSVTNAQTNSDGTITGTDVVTGNTVTVSPEANTTFDQFGNLVNVDKKDIEVIDDYDSALDINQNIDTPITADPKKTAVEILNIAEGEGEAQGLPVSNFTAPTGQAAFLPMSMSQPDPNQVLEQQTNSLLVNAFGGGLASFGGYGGVNSGYSAYGTMPTVRGPGSYGFAGTQNFRTAPQSYGGGYDPSTLTGNLQQAPMASEDLLSQEASFNR